MRKILGYIVVIICVLIYIISSSQRLTYELSRYKTKSKSVFSPDKNRFGDLYGMSYLSYFREHYHNDNTIKPIEYNFKNKINLYVVCDSYIWEFVDSSTLFCGLNHLSLINTNAKEKLTVKLDSTKINIVLFEFSERNVRNIVADSLYYKTVIKSQVEYLATNTDELNLHNSSPVNNSPAMNSSSFAPGQSFMSKITTMAFNQNINTNLELNIWDMSVFRSLKEFKADLNYKLFGSIDKNIKLSNDHKQLFYSPTIDTIHSTSSFNYVSPDTVSAIIRILNNVNTIFKNMGFQKLYLTIVPNPVSVLEPDYNKLNYNNLLERVQNSPQLQMQYIDLMSEFLQLQNKVYQRSDSHWSWSGFYIWLNKFNMELKKLIKEKDTL